MKINNPKLMMIYLSEITAVSLKETVVINY